MKKKKLQRILNKIKEKHNIDLSKKFKKNDRIRDNLKEYECEACWDCKNDRCENCLGEDDP